jgi:hypothetical protein
MKRVVIESPLNAPTREQIEVHKSYAKACILDSLRRGEAPYASHIFFDQPGLLDDLLPEERERGILAGFAWGEAADTVAFYVDFKISGGMRRGFERAVHTDADIVVRSIVTGSELYVPIELVLAGTSMEEIAKERNFSNLLAAATEVAEHSFSCAPESMNQTSPEPPSTSVQGLPHKAQSDPEQSSE